MKNWVHFLLEQLNFLVPKPITKIIFLLISAVKYYPLNTTNAYISFIRIMIIRSVSNIALEGM